MDSTPPTRRIVKAACAPHDCPDTCALDITVEDGRAIAVRGGDMPFTAGKLCTKVARYLDRTYALSRILYPMKRTGAKGEAASSASPGTRRWTPSPRAFPRSP